MASAKQIAWRKKFAKLYSKKGKRSRIKGTLTAKGKSPRKYYVEFNAMLRKKIRATKDPVKKKALKEMLDPDYVMAKRRWNVEKQKFEPTEYA